MALSTDGNTLKTELLAQAARLGVAAAGVTDTSPLVEPHSSHLRDWLAAGRQGGMSWLARRPEQRLAPQLLVPGTRTVIVIAVNYFAAVPEENPVYAVSRYACGRDYHKVLKGILKQLAATIRTASGCRSRWFVDSAPVMEKVLAQRAGLGWIGKNTLLLTREYGSWVLLGELFTEVELPPDDPHPDLCADCSKCLDACPTRALTPPGVLDCRRCISYHTIERPDAEPSDIDYAGSIFGCEICQEVCPWNREVPETTLADLQPRTIARQLRRGELPEQPAAWEKATRGSSLRRISWERLRDNAARASRHRHPREESG